MNYSNSRKLSGTALGIAIFGLISTLIFPVVLPFILSPIAIILAILSKGGRSSLSRQAQIAVIVSVIAIAVNIFMLVFSVVSLMHTLQDPSQRKSLNTLLERTYGVSLDELLNSLPSFTGGNQ